MKSDENIDELISRYNAGTLEKDELERFLKIMKSDPDIRQETDLDKELTEFLKDKELLAFLKVVDEVRYNRRKSNRMNYLLIAAVSIILVAIGSVWIYQYSLNEFNRFPIAFDQGRDVINAEDNQQESPFSNWISPGYHGSSWIKKGQEKELLAANFTPLPYLEGLVGVSMRSTNVSLLSPEFSLQINPGDTVKFQWLGGGEAMPSIEIIDNLGNRIWIGENLSNEEMDLFTSHWGSGLYYWKFLADDNIIYVGKISVIKENK